MKPRPAKRRSPARSRRGRPAIAILLIALTAVISAIAFMPSLRPGDQPPPSEDRPTRQDGSGRTATVATDVLNVRESASVDSAILAAYPGGQRVTIVGELVNGFLPVAYGSGQAWMAAEYLSAGETSLADGWRSRALVQDAAAAEPVGSAPTAAPAEPEPTSAEPDEVAPAVVDEPAPVAEDVPEVDTGGERWIEVDRDTAAVILHDGNTVVASFHGKIGRDLSDDGYYATALGTFHVYSMSKALAPTPFADDVYLTDWVGFDPDRNNGFHSPVRDASGLEKPVQNPTTMGCVRLDAAAAEQVFAFASVGMRVEIHA